MNIPRALSQIALFRRRCRHESMCWRIAVCVALTAAFSAPQPAAAVNTIAHMVTNLGTIDIKLYDDEQVSNQAPITVANFLRYAGRGNYNGIVIHRSVLDFVIQGGGHICFPNPFGPPSAPGVVCTKIKTDPPIQNEFSPSRSNIRGTIAMAKLGGNPNSATDEWFFNLADNSSIFDPVTGQQIGLDYQNGGFTVFGCVLDSSSSTCPGSSTGMAVVGAIAALPIFDGANNSPFYYPCNPDQNGFCTNPTYFDHLPTYNYNTAAYNGNDPTTYLQISNLVVVNSIPNVTATKTLTMGTTSAYAADPDVTLQNPNHNTSGSTTYTTVDTTTSTSWLATFTPPPGKSVQFNDEISQFTMTWTTGLASRAVTLYHGAYAGVSGYYAYGPTPDNPTPHWYDFSYDGTTGAEIVGSKILLHFVDGQRGDDDLTVNGSVTHTGAPVLVTSIPTSSSSSSGCSIAATPPPWRGHGDWILISMFLVFVMLVRRRTRHDRIPHIKNVASAQQ